MKTVGILGGGQLGLMLANSLYTLGAEVVVYDPDPLAPLCRHAGNVVNGSWNDYKKIEEFVKRCDIITYEFENVECDPLRPISAIAPIYPSLDVLAITQNRINETKIATEQKGVQDSLHRPLLVVPLHSVISDDLDIILEL